jgi:ribosomal-protein-alanine N-acetyltransferase
VEKLCFQEDSWPLMDIIAVLTWPGIIRLKALVGPELVGFASAEERSRVGWITTLGVLPDYRRQGIARALLAQCEAQLKTARIRLCVRRGNLSAQQLYLQTGYRQVDIWTRYYRGGEDAFVMEKDR